MESSIITTAERAEQLAASFVTRISNFEKQVVEQEAQATKRAERFSKQPGDQDADVRNIVKRAARDTAKRETHQYRHDLAAGSEKERTDRLKTLLAMDAEATKLAALYESPVQMLSRMGLGSVERSRYTDQLRNAGPRELVNMRDWALHKHDKILAAAVLSRLDAMATKARPFSAVDFATAVVSQEFEQHHQATRRVRAAVQRAVNANRNFERGRVDSTAKISMGLAQRRAV